MRPPRTWRSRSWSREIVPPGLVERVVEASWPGARTQQGQGDPLDWLDGPASVETTELALAEPEWFPIGTTPGSDPLTLGLAALAGLADGETAVIQILAQPATSVEQATVPPGRAEPEDAGRVLLAGWREPVPLTPRPIGGRRRPRHPCQGLLAPLEMPGPARGRLAVA